MKLICCKKMKNEIVGLKKITSIEKEGIKGSNKVARR